MAKKISTEEYLSKLSMKTLKSLKEKYEDPDIISMVGEDAAEYSLEKINFEIMKRDLKKVTRELNKKNLLEDVEIKKED